MTDPKNPITPTILTEATDAAATATPVTPSTGDAALTPVQFFGQYRAVYVATSLCTQDGRGPHDLNAIARLQGVDVGYIDFGAPANVRLPGRRIDLRPGIAMLDRAGLDLSTPAVVLFAPDGHVVRGPFQGGFDSHARDFQQQIAGAMQRDRASHQPTGWHL